MIAQIKSLLTEASDMNTTAPDVLRAALEHVSKKTSELAALTELVESNAALQSRLEEEADLNDNEKLNQIARCQTISALLPRRINHRTDALTEAKKELLVQCHQFVQQHLGPRLRTISKRVEAKVRAVLATQLEGVDLERALSKSRELQEVAGLTYRGTMHLNPQQGTISYAEQLIALWNELPSHEAKLS